MKKTIALVVALAAVYFAGAQNNNLTTASLSYDSYTKDKDMASLQKARARIDTAAKHPDTMNKPKTWYLRGKIYHAFFDRALADQLSKITETDNNKKNILAYQQVTLKDLDTAISSYQRELTLDTKNDWSDEVKKNLRICADDYFNKMYSAYSLKAYEEAEPLAEKTFNFYKIFAGKTDTNSLNIAAYCAERSKQWDKALSLYEKLLALKYQPASQYAHMIDIYKAKGDEAGLKDCIAKARTAFPNEYAFILEELNLAIKQGKTDEALKNLNLAIEKDPKNPELHLVLGQTLHKMAAVEPKPSNYDELMVKSEEQFKLATDLKPDYFNAFYNFGVFYSNWGADILKASDKLTDVNKIKVEEKKANDLFLKAIPLLEKALDLNKTDKDTMRALKQLYAKTGQADTDKYKKLNDMLKN